MVTFAAIVCTAYVAAGVALFATGEAPVIAPGVDFLGDKFSMAWAGWKFSGCFYMALVNWGVGLGPASAMAMVPYVAFDIFAVMDTDHWTPLAYSFIALEAFQHPAGPSNSLLRFVSRQRRAVLQLDRHHVGFFCVMVSLDVELPQNGADAFVLWGGSNHDVSLR